MVVSISLLWSCTGEESARTSPWRVVTHDALVAPSDIEWFDGGLVFTSIIDDVIVFADSLEFESVATINAGEDERWRSPHHLAVSPWGTLLFSEGWGSGIVELTGDADVPWRKFEGIGVRMRAPHGICIDEQGWIYVGDSLNSRLLRFRDMSGGQFEVFADHDRHVSYIRQLVCTPEGVWISNSYERREGLNPGDGGNILLLEDFDSGEVREMFHVRDANLTGVLPLADGRILFGMWGQRRRLALTDPEVGGYTFVDEIDHGLGIPYSIRRAPDTGDILVAYIGTLRGDGNTAANPGGILVIPAAHSF